MSDQRVRPDPADDPNTGDVMRPPGIEHTDGTRRVVVGVLGCAAADGVLRCGFEHAEDRGVGLRVVLTGDASADGAARQADLVRRWSQKYPEVPVSTVVRRGLDPAVVLAAASRGCGRLVVPHPSTPAGAALIGALSRRARCPVVVVDDRAAWRSPRTFGPVRPAPSGL